MSTIYLTIGRPCPMVSLQFGNGNPTILMRDLNDDLLENPFYDDLKQVADLL